MLTETQTQTRPLLEEANKWIEHLVTYVDSINDFKNKFYKWAAGKTEHDTLVNIEHFHNQFHIQLINLHDLKHSIRHHMNQIKSIPELDYTHPHKVLGEQYNFLTKDLDQLKAEFKEFISE